MARERWSHSKVVRLHRCGEAFRREIEEKDPSPPTSSMVRGTTVHYVAAEGHMRQLAARTAQPGHPKSIVLRESLPSSEEAADLAATRFETEKRAYGIAAPADEFGPASKIIGRDKDTAVRMSRFYVEKVAPFIDPTFVERKIVVEPEDADIAISGILDLGTKDLQGDETIWDTKTGARKPSSNEADTSDQLTMYALLRKLETGKLPARVGLNYIVAEPKANTGVYSVELLSKRTEADIRVAVNRLNNAIEAVRKGVYLANGPGNWWCSPKWCRFHPTCPYVRQPVKEGE